MTYSLFYKEIILSFPTESEAKEELVSYKKDLEDLILHHNDNIKNVKEELENIKIIKN
jgi:hypothetical protein